ncbi:MAG: hypothetical protein O3A20_07475 [Planctomycetota bacterium]|nr:hypothetical protein [Planctomycetota bacterium]
MNCEEIDFDALPVHGWIEEEDDCRWLEEMPSRKLAGPGNGYEGIHLLVLDQERVPDEENPEEAWRCTVEIRNGSPRPLRVRASEWRFWLDAEYWRPELSLWELDPAKKCGNCLRPYSWVEIAPGGSLQRRMILGSGRVKRPVLEVVSEFDPSGGLWVRSEGPSAD